MDLKINTDSKYFLTINYEESISNLSKLKNLKSFDSENLKVDYISFNFKSFSNEKSFVNTCLRWGLILSILILTLFLLIIRINIRLVWSNTHGIKRGFILLFSYSKRNFLTQLLLGLIFIWIE